MKKSNFTFYLLLVVSLIFTACKKQETPEPLGKYEGGVLIVNEGSFGDADGSVSFLSAEDKITNNIFKAENEQIVGGIIQALRVHDSYAVMVTNGADKVIVANAKDFKKQHIITDAAMVNPIDFAGVGNKGYVSQWGKTDFVTYPEAAIKVIDLTAGTITKTISLSAKPQGVLAYNGKVYVALEGSDKIAVINPDTDAVEANITVAKGPSRMVLDANNKIWAMCTSGNLVRVNPADNSVEATITGIKVAGFNEKLTVNNSKDKIYYLAPAPWPSSDVEVFAIDITATTAPTTALIKGTSFYGIGVAKDGNIYIGNSAGFQGVGKVERYKADGTKIDEMEAGRGTSNFVF
jgi:YVTN family beta-propeller protein